MDDKPRRRFRFGLISVFAIVTCFAVLAGYWNPIPNSSGNKFSLVKPGMTIADVTAIVGPPDAAHSDAATGRTGVTVHEYVITPGEKTYFVNFLKGKVTGVIFVIGPGPRYPPSS